MKDYLCESGQLFYPSCSLVFLTIMTLTQASAQVEPLGHGPSPTGSVTPQTIPPVPGSVSPLPFDEQRIYQVMAEGREKIHDGTGPRPRTGFRPMSRH